MNNSTSLKKLHQANIVPYDFFYFIDLHIISAWNLVVYNHQ